MMGYEDRWDQEHGGRGCSGTAMWLMVIVIVCLSCIGGLLSRLVG